MVRPFKAVEAVNDAGTTVPAKRPATPTSDPGTTPGLLWRQIESSLRNDILSGILKPGVQLPPDRQIADRFKASRMTARRALAALEQQGLIRIQQGQGMFVSRDLIDYQLGERVRFNENLWASHMQSIRHLLSAREEQAASLLAARLRIPIGAPVLYLTTLAGTDGTPIVYGQHWYSAERFRGLDEAFRRTGSFSAALREFGVADYRRQVTEIIARMPSAEEARLLQQPRSCPVLRVESIDVDMTDAPIRYAVGCFAGERVRFVVGNKD